MMEQLTPEQLAYIIQFQHPEKLLAQMPGLTEELVATLFGLSLETYQAIRTNFANQARETAQALLAEADFAVRVDRLPFSPGATIVGLGDSITDDYQSWLEILRHLLELRRPGDQIKVVNAGISGDTTSQMITRFLAVVAEQPEWIFCMAGTNDARLHGQSPTKTLVSIEETEKNLTMLRNYAATQTSARWVWLTPATVIQTQIANDWLLGSFQLMWLNQDLRAVADVVKHQLDPVIDLQALFGVPPAPELLLSDGLHPSLAGQKVIVKALVECLSEQ